MTNPRKEKKAAALLAVLATIIVVVVLANVVLYVMSSQSRLTHHQISRIQAYYANWAAINYAMDKLRSGNWSAGTYTLARQGADVNEPDLPATIKDVNIQIRARGPGCNPPGNTLYCIEVTADYEYTP